MIKGGGGRVGQGPNLPDPVREEGAAKAATPAAGKPPDSFEKSTRPAAATPKGLGAAHELLKQAQANPATAAKVAEGLALQAGATLHEIEAELVKSRALVGQLASERFARGAQEKLGPELKRQRDKLAGLKLRHQATRRKLALLRQLAGCLDESRLGDEIDQILSHHGKLKTDWGRRHHLLSLGDTLFGVNDATPEHLREVIRAEVRAQDRGEELGEALQAVSPRRALAELVARTLDGTQRSTPEEHTAALRGEFGEAARAYALLVELIERSLSHEPYTKRPSK